MKQLLFVLFTLLTLIGCGEDKEMENAPTLGMYTSPYDTTLVVSIEIDGNGTFLHLYRNGKSANKTYISSYKKTIDKGYGEKETYEASPNKVVFLKDRIILLNSSYEGDFGFLDFFTTNIEFISNYEILELSSWWIASWDGYSFFAGYFTNKKEDKIDFFNGNGDIRESFLRTPETRFPNQDYTNITFDNLEYITIKNDRIERNSVKNGEIWWVNYHDHVKNKPETETNKPQIEYSKYNFSNDIISIYLNVTYYSGEKEQVILKIDASTGKII